MPNIFLGLFISILFSLSVSNRDKRNQKMYTPLENVVMCTSFSNYSDKLEMEDIYTAKEPLAPIIETKWKTKLNITSTSEKAKLFFNQGLFHLYAFNHNEADRSFKEAIRQDPECAMCHWGVALGLGPNINMLMQDDNIQDAYDYAQKANTLSDSCTSKEKALIKSLTTRYSLDTTILRSDLDSIYADEMRLVTQQYRDDNDIATLFVEALMNRMPWQYWHPDSSPKLLTREAQAVLDYIRVDEPNHPGANHYYIHLVEEVHPEQGIVSADSMATTDYAAGHLVHMPSHIYIQTGKYNETTIANKKAVKVDEEYINQCKIQGVYPTIYFTHNIHFLSFSASMEGRAKISIDAARKLVDNVSMKMIQKYKGIEQYMPMPYFALTRFERWEDIINEKQPPFNLPYTNMIWHYSRGLAYANMEKIEEARFELKNIETIQEQEQFKALDKSGFPVLKISEMTALVLKAEIAGAENNIKRKITLLKKAVAIQDSIPFVETPYFFYPIRQSLGKALLDNNQYERAEKIYVENLNRWPKNGWSLHGLKESLQKQGEIKQSKLIESQFQKAWQLADVKLTQSGSVLKTNLNR